MEVVSAHIVSRAGVADPSQADRGELALWRGEMLGRTPTPPTGAAGDGTDVPTHNSPRVWPSAPGRRQASPAGTARSGSTEVAGHATHPSHHLPALGHHLPSRDEPRTPFSSQGYGSGPPQPCCPQGSPQPSPLLDLPRGQRHLWGQWAPVPDTQQSPWSRLSPPPGPQGPTHQQRGRFHSLLAVRAPQGPVHPPAKHLQGKSSVQRQGPHGQLQRLRWPLGILQLAPS